MNGNCHFLFGAAVSSAVAVNVNIISTYLPNITTSADGITLLVLGGLLGSILPDIDNPKSHIGQLTAPVSTVIGKWGKLTGKTIKKHRGFLHDPLLYITGLILSYLYFPPLIGLFLGCLSHIYLDLFNPAGVPFILGTRYVHLGSIPSDSKGAKVFTWMSIAAVGVIATMAYLFMPLKTN